MVSIFTTERKPLTPSRQNICIAETGIENDQAYGKSIFYTSKNAPIRTTQIDETDNNISATHTLAVEIASPQPKVNMLFVYL